MYTYSLAYRHANGEVEGFAACAFTKDAAQKRALAMVRGKCNNARIPYVEANIINSNAGLSAEEIKTVRQDWALCLQGQLPGCSGLEKR